MIGRTTSYQKKESIGDLKAAKTPMASYYLGCIYYNLASYEKAAFEWEKTVSVLDFAPAYHNLALACFDHIGKCDKALEFSNRAKAVNCAIVHSVILEKQRSDKIRSYFDVVFVDTKNTALFKNTDKYTRSSCVAYYVGIFSSNRDKALKISRKLLKR